MNRNAFFAAIRPAFGPLDGKQVEGMEHLLEAGKGLPLHHMANVLAQVRRETGGYMYPIKETVMPSHKNKNPSDAEVIRRLDRAFSAGKLPWVKTPYWRDGWFGRGQIQLTHKANYDRFGLTDPAQAMDPQTSARIAVMGMSRGMFTGRKLSDYVFPDALDASPSKNPRRIVNGTDGSDQEVARFHREFAAALEKAGWGLNPVENKPASRSPHVNETAKPSTRPDVQVKKPPQLGIGAALAALLAALAVGLSQAWERIAQFFGG